MKNLLLLIYLFIPFWVASQTTTTYTMSGSSGNSGSSTLVSYACSGFLSGTYVVLIGEKSPSSNTIKFYLAKNTNTCTSGGNSNFSGGTWKLFSNGTQLGSTQSVGSSSSTTGALNVTFNHTSGFKNITAQFTSTVSGQTWSMSFISVTAATSCTLSAPSSGYASNITANGFRANWNAVSGASSYTINMTTNGSSYPGTQVTTSNTYYNFSSLSSGTQYKYQVRANCSNSLYGLFGSTLATPTTLTPQPNLTMGSNVSFGTTSLYTGVPKTLTFSVSNTGSASWSGSMYVALSNGNTISMGSASINSGSSRSYSTTFTPSISDAGTNITATAKYQTGGTGSGITVPNQSVPTINIYALGISGSAVSPSSGTQNSTNFTFTANLNGVAPSPTLAPAVSIEFIAPDNQTYTTSNIPNTSGNTYSKTQTLAQVGTYQYRYIVYQDTRPNAATGWQSVLVSAPTCTIGVPSSGTANTITGTSFTANWASVSGATEYQINYAKNSDPYPFPALSLYTTSTSYNITGLQLGTEYKYQVRAKCTNGIWTAWSPTLDTPSTLGPITLNPLPTPMTWHCDKTLTWSSLVGTGNITIELWNTNVSTYNVLASNIPNTGSFTWNVGKENSNATDIANFDVNNSYYLKIYPHNTTGQGSQSGAFTIDLPTLNISQPTATTYYKGTNMNIAWGTSSNYCGNVTLEYTNSSNTTLGVIVQNTSNDGTEVWAIPSGLADGQYKIKIYAPVSSGNSPIVQYSSLFTVSSDPNCPNCITGRTVADFATTAQEGLCAAQYLCSQKIIKTDQSPTSPTTAILRQDLAKMVLISLLDNPASVDLENNPNAVSFPADNFPVPYNDLSGSAATCCGSYHRYAKVLSYLDYGDGMPPFVRRASFNPTSTIQRIDLLQVYLEAWNIDESTASGVTLYFNDLAAANLTSQQLLYLKKAVELGLVLNGTAATPKAFRPTDAATREEAFLILKRLRTSTLVTKPTQSIVTNVSSYFVPANLTPQNMSIARGMDQGNFSHYAESGFGISDVGFSLGFDFNYQSFLTEIPDDWKLVEPMGRGWTHSYNSYIFTTISSNDPSAKPLLVVAWGDGTFDTYDNTSIPVGFTSTELPNHASKIGIGNYDILSRPNSSTYTIKKKDQSIITFTSQGEAGIFRLSSVTDKNSNTMSIVYKTGTTIAWIPSNKVIDYVQAPSGRKATFSYNADNYITNILFPGASAGSPRNLTFTYNSRELKTYKDARGQVINKVTTYNYGTGLEAYLLKEIILPKGNKVVNGYNGNRKLVDSKIYGSNGAMTSSTTVTHPSIYNTITTGMDGIGVENNYNTNGLPSTSTNAIANINISRVYDSNHPTQVASFTSNGVTTTSTFYANGNLDQVNYPTSIGGYEKYTYDGFNNPLTQRDAKGNTSTMTYPDNKNLGTVSKADGNGNTVSQTFTYWSNGLLKTSTDNENILTNFAYDAYGNLNSVNIPVLSLTMTSVYDYASRKTSSTNFKSQTTTYTYDENDNLKTETDAQSHTTTMAYDDNDNPSTITNAKGKITTLTYDAFDRNETQTFEGSTNTYIYDNTKNRLAEFRKAGYATDNSRRFVYTYDASTGLLKSNGYIQNIDYDAKNRMSGIRGGNNSSHLLDMFAYDDLNRILSYRDYYNVTVGYGYDLNSNITRIDYPNGNKLYKSYDNLNRIKTLTWNSTLVATYNYVGSRLDNVVYGNGVKTQMGYDNAGRPNSLSTKTNNGAGATIFASSFTMDNLGNHLSETETHPFGSFSVPQANTETYAIAPNNRIGSITKSTGNGGTVIPFTYDGDGNVTNKGGFGNGRTFDLEDNMTSYNDILENIQHTYEYDALGNRRKAIRNGVETRYVLDINGLATILAETNSSGIVQNYYLHGLGLVARIKADGTFHYYHSDFRGSTVAMTNASQTITHKYQYDEFGNVLNTQEADFNPFRYLGAYGIMYESPDLNYMRARYFDPTTGRFNSEDPIWSTNLYPYAGNNGVMNVDVTGNSLISAKVAMGLFGAFIGGVGYLATTPVNSWTSRGAIDEMAKSLTQTIITDVVFKFVLKRLSVAPGTFYIKTAFVSAFSNGLNEAMWKMVETRSFSATQNAFINGFTNGFLAWGFSAAVANPILIKYGAYTAHRLTGITEFQTTINGRIKGSSLKWGAYKFMNALEEMMGIAQNLISVFIK